MCVCGRYARYTKKEGVLTYIEEWRDTMIGDLGNDVCRLRLLSSFMDTNIRPRTHLLEV